jgi:hypothetical protein
MKGGTVSDNDKRSLATFDKLLEKLDILFGIDVPVCDVVWPFNMISGHYN